MQNYIMGLPKDKQYLGYSALMGLLMSQYKISDEEMEKFTAEATRKTMEVSHERAIHQ